MINKTEKIIEERKKHCTENVKLGFLVVISIGIIAGSYLLFWQIQKQNVP